MGSEGRTVLGACTRCSPLWQFYSRGQGCLVERYLGNRDTLWVELHVLLHPHMPHFPRGSMLSFQVSEYRFQIRPNVQWFLKLLVIPFPLVCSLLSPWPLVCWAGRICTVYIYHGISGPFLGTCPLFQSVGSKLENWFRFRNLAKNCNFYWAVFSLPFTHPWFLVGYPDFASREAVFF